MLKLRKNRKGRFIIFSLLGIGWRARTVIFPKGAKAAGWFGVTRIIKETLIEGHKKPSLTPRSAAIPFGFDVGRSFANVF